MIVETAKSKTTGVDGTTGGIEATVVEPAVPPDNQSSPLLLVSLGLALAVGLAIAFIVVVLRETLNSRVRNTRDLRKHFEIPVIAALPLERSLKRAAPRLAPVTSERFAETLRLLRTRLNTVESLGSPVVAFTSPGVGNGKTTVATYLGIAVAETGKRVVMIDGDLRTPRLSALFGTTGDSGLGAVLEGSTATAKPAPTETANLTLLATNAVPGDTAALLGSDTMTATVQTLASTADIIIVDAGSAVADGASLAPIVDEFIVVVRAGRTRYKELRAALGSISAAGGHVFGIVLNGTPRRGPDSGN